MNPRTFLIGATVTVVAAIIIGIFTVGGPNEARREMFDLRRYQDLEEIAYALNCPNWRVSRPILPDKLNIKTIRSYCGGIEILPDVLIDDETNRPYTYIRENEYKYSICADFYDAEKTTRLGLTRLGDRSMASFNPDTGCATGLVH